MQLNFTQVDAFADRPFSGNSAAVIRLDSWLPDALMQSIAMENNLSETAFLVPTSGDADYELRWFTPTIEVAMCGHATLASGHVILAADPERRDVLFRTVKAGILKVTRADTGYILDLPAISSAPAQHDTLLHALGTPNSQLFAVTSGAEQTHIILLQDEAAVRAVQPDFNQLATIDTMAIITAPGDDSDIVSRVFVPAWGVDEDPVTGSAHAALIPFWAQRLGRDVFTAFQASPRGGQMGCKLVGNRVELTGGCVTVITGVFQI